MTAARELAPGTRVRLRSPSHVLQLQANTGRIVRHDEWLDYYIVRLDKPARYQHADGHIEELNEIREDVDNMEVLPE